ncbi:MAG: neutral zinc metallopeptidase [Pseudomonadota bacterium]
MVRWRDLGRSDNIEDRRGQRGKGGGGFRFPFPRGGRGRQVRVPMGRGRGGGGMSIFTLLIIGAVMYFVFGINPLDLLTGGSQAPAPQIDSGRTTTDPSSSPGQFDIPGMPGSRDAARQPGRQVTERQIQKPRTQDEAGQFVSAIFNNTEEIWKEVFPTFGKRYREPNLVLYTGFTNTGCGPGQAAMGPFYCPLDQKVYIDLTFFRTLEKRFGAPGDFAQAYVIAHEVGHHVQTILGIANAVQNAKARNPRAANRIQVMMELQADCLAGVWANRADRARNILEPGDIEEGLNAAAAIGDDVIQKRSGQRVNPHSFTHGSAAQRQRWFRAGFQSGNMNACDTFNADRL